MKQYLDGFSIARPRHLRALRRIIFSVAAFCVSLGLAAQPATLVKDIYPGSGARATFYQHSDMVRSGNLVYFASQAGESGMELWKTNGTAAGTALLSDLTSGSFAGDSGPGSLTDVNGTLFFTISNGKSLWKTDGTAPGTVPLLQAGSFLGGLISVGGTLFFNNNAPGGMELWKSDGSAPGTVLIAKIGVPTGEQVAVGNTLFFAATDNTNGTELWKSDGTPAGTGVVKDIVPGASGSGPQRLTAFGNGIVFTAFSSAYGYELWKSDGTAAGTVLVKDIIPGPAGSSPALFTPFNGFLLFVASDAVSGSGTGFELWRTDGTEAGTVLVRDIKPGPASPFIDLLTPGPGGVYFRADDGVTGSELWRTDGTFAGTQRVADIYPGAGGSSPSRLTNIGGTLYFTAIDVSRGRELFRSDGTEAGTFAIRDVGVNFSMVAFPGGFLFFGNDAGINHFDALWKSDGTSVGTNPFYSFDVIAGSSPRLFAGLGSEIFFAATNAANGEQLWKTDGTDAGTQLLTAFDRQVFRGVDAVFTLGGHVFVYSDGYLWSIAAGTTDLVRLVIGTDTFGSIGGTLYFRRFGQGSGQELWKSDGTPSGTQIVKSFSSDTLFELPVVGVGSIGYFVVRENNKDELWRTDGTPGGTVLVKQLTTFSGVSELTSFQGYLYFTVNDFFSPAIWKSDGTEAGTQSVIPLLGSHLTVVNSTLFFAAFHPMTGAELWKTDGSLNGTHLVKDIRPGTIGSDLTQFVVLGNVLYFVANDGGHGAELWRSDGTDPGTSIVLDIRPGADPSSITGLTASGSLLFFSASEPVSGTELWKSDGTAGGTALVKDIFPGASSAGPGALTDIGGTLYFSAFAPQTGRELWKSDGTPSGTILVKDIDPSPNNGSPGNGVEAGGLLFFAAATADNGIELWKSDGTSSGTVLTSDLIPGPFSSFPRDMTPYGGRLVFSALDEALGFEPWITDGTAAGTFLLKDINPGTKNSSASGFKFFGGKIFFGADDGVHGRELWVTDGTTAGTSLVKDLAPGAGSSNPSGFLSAGGYLFFSASNPQAIWRTDGTPEGTITLSTGFSATPVALGGSVFFLGGTTQSHGLFTSDGTPAGTQLVQGIYPGSSVGFSLLVPSAGNLYFFVSQSFSVWELWKSNGTPGGAALVKGGFPLNFPPTLTAVNGNVFFVIDDGFSGSELWRSDGTTQGTILVKDIFPGQASSEPTSLLGVGEKLLFTANDGVHGYELWQTDGTPQGTALLQDVNPGPASSLPGQNPFGSTGGMLAIAGTRVFFSATDSVSGNELWSLPMSAVCSPPPTPTVTSSKNPSCGGAVTLDAGPGYASYLWSTGETTRTIIVSPDATTTYTVYTGNAAGCRSSSTFVQSVDPAAVPAPPVASNNGPICAGETLQLSASTIPGAAYSWTGPNAFASTEQNPQILSAPASASGTYAVRVMVNGCISPPAATSGLVRPLPSASVSAGSSVCPNSPGNSASVPSAGAGATYAWEITNGTITSGAGTASITFTAGDSGSVDLSVTVTDSHGCDATGTKSVAIVAGPTCGVGFFALTPCRVADTRDAPGPSGGPELEAGTVRTFPVASICGIPPSAKAVAINLAVFLPSSDGDLRVYPAGQPVPLASSVNFRSGIVRANNAIIALGVSGEISVQCDMPSGGTHFFIDVFGYFE